MRDLKTSLHLTVHGSKKSVEELADKMGISASYLYRACLDGESGCRFPLDLLIPLMQATGDYSVLDHLNARSERITVSLPRVRKMKRKDPEVVNTIQANFNDAFALFYKFWSDPSRQVDRDALLQALHKHQCDVEAMKRSVRDFDQGDLF